MRAFHGDPAIKAKYLARVEAHMAADHLVRGQGWGRGSDGVFRGCAVGCTLEAYDHSRYPKELGLPEWLAYLQDGMFEGMPAADAMTWPKRFLEAIPVGADVEPVRWQLAIWRHERQVAALESNPEPYASQCRGAIRGVIEFCRSQLSSHPLSESARSAAEVEALEAAEAAWSATAAWSAGAEAAARSARSAAWSAAWSAWSAGAARSAAAGALAAAARSAAGAWIAESEMLLTLLRACPGTEQS